MVKLPKLRKRPGMYPSSPYYSPVIQGAVDLHHDYPVIEGDERMKPVSQLTVFEVRRELEHLVHKAGPDERRVLLFICRRFVGIGQNAIGQLDLAAEQRDGFQETAEEAADALFYMSLRFLMAQLRPPKTFKDLDHPGPARYRNEAGQLVEDDDVPEEDWP